MQQLYLQLLGDTKEEQQMVKQQRLLEQKASKKATCPHVCRNKHRSHFLGVGGGVKGWFRGRIFLRNRHRE